MSDIIERLNELAEIYDVNGGSGDNGVLAATLREAVRETLKLREVADAAHANQQHVAAMPWHIDEAYDPHATCVDRGMFRNWLTGTSTSLDLALKKLEAVE